MVSLSFGTTLLSFGLPVSFAAESWAVLEYSNKSMWQPPLYPIKTVIPVAVGLVLLQNIAELLRSVLTVFNIDYDDPREQEEEIDIDPEMLATATKADVAATSDNR